jgi:MerR family transcriptional regulator, thiopeptide resistance regulator
MTDLTVGAVAARTGLTVRTLHHYDHIGLLSPSGRTDAGYRLYTQSDIRRLETIALLRNLGLSLTEVATAVDRDPDLLVPLLEQHRERVQAKLEDARRMVARLDHVAERLRTHSPRSGDDALDTIRIVTTFEQYFREDQIEAIRAHARELGGEYIREVEAEWPRLIAAVRQEMHLGTDPGDERVLALARRWRELVDEFVNGRFDIAAGAGRMLAAEPAVRQRTGLDDDVMEYVARAAASLR